MSEYVKKPKTLKAIQYDGNRGEVEDFVTGSDAYSYLDEREPWLTSPNKNGVYIDIYLNRGVWIVITRKGRIKVMDNEKFQKKYTKVGD